MKVYERFGIPLNPLVPKTLDFKFINNKQRLLPTFDPKKLARILNYGVGVEIEIENCNGVGCRGWRTEADGSLRNNGVEYKTPYGTRVLGAYTALTQIQAMFAGERFENPGSNVFTERCSVHVHIDVRNLSLEQLNSVLLLYILVENAFFSYAGNERKHNIFCVPLTQSIVGFQELSFQQVIQRDAEKYAACNLKALKLFGTIEFRHMEGNDDADRIFTWIILISCLLYYAETVSNDEIMQEIVTLKYESQYDKFLAKIFGAYSQYLRIDRNVLDEAVSDAKLFFTKGGIV